MSDGLSRRSFLKLAATAGAAAAIPGCQPAARKLIPYVVPDENVIPGVPTYYATTCNECGAGCGVIAKVREGRVIKLEGNPADPISQGSLCARGQAALQGIYNPDKLRIPKLRQSNGSYESLLWDDALKQLIDQLRGSVGKGNGRIAVIASAQGPTLRLITQAFAGAYGTDKVVFYEPLDDEPAREAAQLCFSRRDLPSYNIDKAEVLVSFGADFLETWQSPVELARQYAAFRDPKKRNGNLTIGRAIYVGPRMNMTAGKSDDWVAIPAGAEATIALSVLNVVLGQGTSKAGIDVAALKAFVASYDPDSVNQRTGVPAAKIREIAGYLVNAEGAVALAGGSDPTAYAAAYILNAATGNLGRTMTFTAGTQPEENTSRRDDITGMLDMMRNGDIDVVIVADANPLYSMPSAWKAADAFAKVPLVVWAGQVPDETAAIAHLQLPIHHPLETWRDTNPRVGVAGLGQPVMQPVFDSRSLGDILIGAAQFTGSSRIPWKDTADAVKTTWLKANPRENAMASENFWLKTLSEGGIFQEPAAATVSLNVAALKAPPTAPDFSKISLYTYPHIFLYDGRGANKPWLQEIPEPVAQFVWDTWAEIHPDTVKDLGVKENELIEVSSSEGSFQAPVYSSERVAKGVIAVPLGQGHTGYGRYAKDRGANPFVALRAGEFVVAVNARGTGVRRPLVTPLYPGGKMLGRSIAESVSLEQLSAGEQPYYVEEPTPPYPYEMYASFDASRKRMWGMTIDTNACTGCSACVAACYAENNVPVVGKERVAEGRIMSWIRIERFYPDPQVTGEPEPLLHIVPMLCQQCDHAPCEPVCPVFAAVHNEEGLNSQIYNRCIGTRYCENNCPYKVRRFNWFYPDWPEPLNLQLNPDVTQRAAGVMEKCTFCIQRIVEIEITAQIDHRELRDGEIVTACQQACPTRAISFGDMKQSDSAMMQRRAANKDRGYKSLKELNTLPAIDYLRNVYHQREKA